MTLITSLRNLEGANRISVGPAKWLDPSTGSRMGRTKRYSETRNAAGSEVIYHHFAYTIDLKTIVNCKSVDLYQSTLSIIARNGTTYADLIQVQRLLTELPQYSGQFIL